MKTPRPLDADALWKLERVGAVALSPDGRNAVVAVTVNNGDSASSAAIAATRLWLLPTDRCAPRALTAAGSKDTQPAWSPQGDRIAFISKREQQGKGDAAPQLYVIPAGGGEAERCSDFAPGIEAFKWLPNGRGIVFSTWTWPDAKTAVAQARRHKRWSERKQTGYATSEAYYRYWDESLPQGRVLTLWLLHLESGRVTALFRGTALELPRANDDTDFDVHPGGRRVAFVHDPAREQRISNPLALAEIDIRSRRVSTLAADAAWNFSAPRYSPDGRHLAALAAHVGRKHTAPSEAVLIGRDGNRRMLAPGWDHAVDAPLRWTAAGNALVVAAEERGRCPLWRLRLDGSAPDCIHAGGWVQGFDCAGDTLAVVADSALHPPRVLAGPVDSGATLRLERFNDTLLAGVDLGEVRETTLAGAAGDPVQMWLVFPPGFDAKKRHAALHVIHGGPFAAAGDSWSWRWNPHVLAGRGHVVAQVNYHGSSGFGHAFADSIVGRQGALELQDIEAATDWLCTQRWIDPRRIAVSGASYGGFLVAWINGHMPAGRYQATVCHAGVFDRVATFAADSYLERPRDLGAFYWDDMDKVLAQSPATFAGAMATPTLVVHGALDYRVPDCNGLAYYNTLKARGVAARLLWFPDENHWVLKRSNSLLWYREVLDWVDVWAPARAKTIGASAVRRAGAAPVLATPASAARP